jgi:hypothetical protein
MRTRNKVLAVALPAIALAGAILYFRPDMISQKPGYQFEKKMRLLERVEKELIYGGGERYVYAFDGTFKEAEEMISKELPSGPVEQPNGTLRYEEEPRVIWVVGGRVMPWKQYHAQIHNSGTDQQSKEIRYRRFQFKPDPKVTTVIIDVLPPKATLEAVDKIMEAATPPPEPFPITLIDLKATRSKDSLSLEITCTNKGNADEPRLEFASIKVGDKVVKLTDSLKDLKPGASQAFKIELPELKPGKYPYRLVYQTEGGGMMRDAPQEHEIQIP